MPSAVASGPRVIHGSILALGMKPAVAGYPHDLDASELKELELALERPATDLPEAMIPAVEPLGQFVEVTGAQRLQEHEPSPGGTFNRREFCSFPT